MCRWLTYRGPAIHMDELIYKPQHSLIEQALHAEEAKAATNGDGFGVGWFAERVDPGTYHEILPAWNDANLKNLAYQIKAKSFFAHVRASTGTATSRSNCHPFSHKNWLFMHNGQIGNYLQLRRKLESLIPDDLYCKRHGTTDSEVIFYLMVANGLEDNPVKAIERTIAKVMALMREIGATQPFRLTAPFTDGKRFYAARFSSDEKPPSLYYQCNGEALTVVSEPLDKGKDEWNLVPPSSILISEGACDIRIQPLEIEGHVA